MSLRIKRADYDNPICARCYREGKMVDWTLAHKDFFLCARCSRVLEMKVREFVLLDKP